MSGSVLSWDQGAISHGNESINNYYCDDVVDVGVDVDVDVDDKDYDCKTQCRC